MQTLAFKEIAWEDRNASIKIMLFLNEVGNHDKNKIKVQFTPDSIEVEVKEFKGINYHFNRFTFGGIVPEKSKYTISANRINVIAQKEKEGPWRTYQKEKEMKQPKFDNKDPNGGLMDLMKQMYKDGDDEMKRTIAKAWTDAQDSRKNGKDPLADESI